MAWGTLLGSVCLDSFAQVESDVSDEYEVGTQVKLLLSAIGLIVYIR